jgi:CMP-N,N'-diacetyllegionaminic acid synthase
MKTLFVITARGGSKGIPKKNSKLLGNKPLIAYSIDIARQCSTDDTICVSTDSEEIKKVVENYGLTVPFLRPYELATDTAGSFEVLAHALEFYEKQGQKYDAVVLLQPTSPFRQAFHVKECLEKFTLDIDMVVSVKHTHANPYSVLFEEDKNGFLQKSKQGNFHRRQDVPQVWEVNGAVYVINAKSLKNNTAFSQFSKVIKYEMEEKYSLDIDSTLDWEFAEFLLNKKFI